MLMASKDARHRTHAAAVVDDCPEPSRAVGAPGDGCRYSAVNLTGHMRGGGSWRALLLAALIMSGGNARAAEEDPGRALFKRSCGICHTAERGGASLSGPNLFAVVGRQAGRAPSFRYSPSLEKANWKWNERNLDIWLANSRDGHPSTDMVYRQPNPEKRALIVQYLNKMK